MKITEPIIQQYEYSAGGETAGLPISKIIISESTRGGGQSSETPAKRISELAVPYGLVVFNDMPSHTISYKSSHPTESSHPTQTSNVIPDDLYDKLLGMVESDSSSKTKSKYSRKTSNTISKTKTQTKRIRIKPDL
jgi:hypothetical protein